MSRIVGLVLSAAVSLGLTSCGHDDSYEAAEGGLRGWLEAVHDRDPAACDLMTEEYRRDFAEKAGRGLSCSQTVESASLGMDLPPPQSQMGAPAWDPSGEALIEVTYDQQVVGFWMQLVEGRWMVAGTAT